MRKLVALLIAAFAIVGLSGCGEKFDRESQKIVLITDKGDITDRSFNQGAYEGVKAFAEREEVRYGYLKPTEANNEQYVAAINQAIADGATIIVTPGFLFEEPIGTVQSAHKKVKFILLDGAPSVGGEVKIAKNVASIFYAEEQTGFLAGYAAVKDGFRKLGFMGGMAVPAVQRFGHGYVQGAAKAADELGLADNAVTIQYLYTGDFQATPDVQAAAATMYAGGVEVIFACGGAVGQSVMAAATAAGTDKWVIGVDVDQSGDSPRVITSSTKNLKGSVEQALAAIFDGTFGKEFGGKSVILDVEKDGVGLPMASSRFREFNQAAYDAIYGKLVDGTVKVSSVIGAFGDDGNAAKQFETAKVKVTVVPFGS
ncbi:MAG: BMP family ABC transporter substrate-binding protein [Acholeplasmatales bacterium]